MGCTLLHQGSRGIFRQAMGHQLAADNRNTVQPHVEHNRMGRSCQSFPVKIHTAVFKVAGNKGAGLCIVPVRQRDSGIGCTACCSRNARDHLERYTLFAEGLDLLAAASEDKRISAFQTQYSLALLCQSHEQLIDAFLGQCMAISFLAGIYHFGIPTHHVEYRLCHQPVIHHHICLLHQSQCPKGDQVRIARAGTDEVNLAAGNIFPVGVIDGLFQGKTCLVAPTREQQLRYPAL